jgi:hypothetical protein
MFLTNYIAFSYPGFETTSFHVGVFSVVDVPKMLQNPNKVVSLSREQWRDCLISATSVGKEMMQVCYVSDSSN